VLAQLIREVFQTFRDPRDFARRVLLPRDQTVQASVSMAALASVLNMVQMAALLAIADSGVQQEIGDAPHGADLDATGMTLSFHDLVLITGGASFAQFVLLSFGGAFIGRLAGGRGEFRDLAAVAAWYSLCVVIVGILISVMELVLGPSLAGVAAIMLLLYGFWMLAALIGEAHGFERTGVVLVGLFAGIAGFAMVAATVLNMTGVLGGAG